MTKSAQEKRLDKIEIELTPKEWAIRLIDEIRSYPSEKDFLKAITTRTYHESPYWQPFYALAEQAEDRFPGSKPQAISKRNELDQKLRMEFHALKILITFVNETIKSKTEIYRLKADAFVTQLRHLILQDAFLRTTEGAIVWAKQCYSTDADREAIRKALLNELGAFSKIAGPQARLSSLIDNWADNIAALLVAAQADDRAVHVVGNQYFDGRAILSRDVEDGLKEVTHKILNAIALFNEYLSTRRNRHGRDGESEHEVGLGPIDVGSFGNRIKEMLVDRIVDSWVTSAHDTCVADELRKTGQEQDFYWEHVKEQLESTG